MSVYCDRGCDLGRQAEEDTEKDSAKFVQISTSKYPSIIKGGYHSENLQLEVVAAISVSNS